MCKSFLDLDNGEKPRATIIKAIENHDNKMSSDKEHVRFRCSVNDDGYEKIMSCNEVLDLISGNSDTDIEWSVKKMLFHEGPLAKDSPNCKGSTSNIMIEWENGETTAEPLSIVGKDAPAVCAMCARDNNLLNLPGWMQFKRLAKGQKKLFCMVNQAKLCSYRTASRCKCRCKAPKDCKHALELDKKFSHN